SPPPLPPSSPPGEQNIFQIREQETSDKKLEYFRFQNQIFHGYNWTNMFVHVLRCLCQLDSSKLMQASRKSQGFKISDNPKSVNSTNRAIKSIGNGLFTSANNSTPQKIRYLKIALEIFDMKNDLSVKFS
ncbi:MAG: hypothetical protein OXF48_02555, partial [Bacteroidetes bacterium]|nr:hypothetical protein [Bacteroidota bacterium]